MSLEFLDRFLMQNAIDEVESKTPQRQRDVHQ